MSVNGAILSPVGRIKGDRLRRLVLVVWAAPACALSLLAQLVFAPIAFVLLLSIMLAIAAWEALCDAVSCAIVTSVQEPGRWLHLAKILRRVWSADQETWLSRQPRLITRKPGAAPTS